MSQFPSGLWASQLLPPEQVLHWQFGPLTVWMDYRNEELRVATSYQERGNGDCFARLEENSPESGGVAERFDQEGIEIPFPHRTLYTGDVTAPFPIRIVENPAESKPGQA